MTNITKSLVQSRCEKDDDLKGFRTLGFHVWIHAAVLAVVSRGQLHDAVQSRQRCEITALRKREWT